MISFLIHATQAAESIRVPSRRFRNWTRADLSRRFTTKFIESMAEITTETGCWLWLGNWDNRSGYGVISNNDRPIGVHRISYLLYKGEIPPRMCVCHKCDTRPCFNPDHLFLGTNGENNLDRASKGQYLRQRGEGNGRARLNEDQAREIYALKGKVSLIDLMERYGVGHGTITCIWSKRNWRHIHDSV